MTSPSRQRISRLTLHFKISHFWNHLLIWVTQQKLLSRTLIEQKEEEADPQQESSTLPEQTECEVDTTDLLGLGDEAGPVGEASVASEPSASVPEPAVADTSGVATEANTSCPDQIVPPPTSPNLVEPGTEPIQVGHSPATSSNPPRQRVRSSRGGATTRWQEAKRAWWNDFEAYQNWLYHNSGGDIVGGFWLRKIPYEQADESTRWLIALHSRLVEEFPTSQCFSFSLPDPHPLQRVGSHPRFGQAQRYFTRRTSDKLW